MRPELLFKNRQMRPLWRFRVAHRGLHTNVVKTLRERQFVNAVTSEDIVKHVENQTSVYCGVDPTAESLHLGNMVTLMGLLHFHIAGHKVVPLVGNATGMIGDPSGRSTERVALERETLGKNVAGIEKQLIRFFSRGTEYAAKRIPELSAADAADIEIAHNADWYKDMSILEFLGHIGRYARVGTMMARDSVKSRLESTQGISFTEFSYQLLQAYDFWYLYHNHGCRIQIGGSDQWGNITAGTDLIHRMSLSAGSNTGVIASDSKAFPPEDQCKDKAFGLTISLLTTASGIKFGKSAGNAIWLDETKTSPFEIYQFFMKTADADVEKQLRIFTLLPISEINEVMAKHRENPEQFAAQKLLASEATELIHGVKGVQQAQCATEVLFGSWKQTLDRFTAREFADAFALDKRMVSLPRHAVSGKSISDITVLIGACKSKSEAARLVRGGGLYWNNGRVSDSKWVPDQAGSDFIGQGTVGIIRTGKTNYHILYLLDN